MIRSIVGGVIEGIIGRFLLAIGLVVVTMGVGIFLVYGTDLLVAVGLSRNMAGNITAGVAIIGSIVGLGAFGYYGIDW